MMITHMHHEWQTKRVRFLTSPTVNEERRALLSSASQVTFLPMEAVGEKGELDLSNVREIDDVRTGYTMFFDGDVLVAKITPCFENGKGALVRGTLSGVGFGSTEFHVLTPGPGVDGRFLFYVTASAPFRTLGEASMTGAAGQKRVTEEFVRNFRVPLPSFDEQRAIADFLDCETARLDALVAAKERMLRLLADKRRALITRAVTRGINPDAPLQYSGVDWLGEIPAHWEIERSRWLFRERDERSVTGDEELLTVSHLTGVTPRSEKDVNMFEAATNEGYKICRVGDLVVNTLWAWMGAMGVASIDGIVSPAYNVYTPGERLVPGYIDAMVRTRAFAEEVTRYSKGVWSSRLRLYPEGFFEVVFPVPPVEDQEAIVAKIRAENEKVQVLISAAERIITLLKERRTALISAAVTGQLPVSKPAEQVLPEEEMECSSTI